MRALVFGAEMAQAGYNIFVTGSQGSGRHSAVRHELAQIAARMPAPPDWCYVHNFAMAHRPMALRFPAGEGAAFRAAMRDFIETLKEAMARLFQSEEYRSRRAVIEEEFRNSTVASMECLRQKAEGQGLTLVEDEGQFELAPYRDGLAISEDEYRRLPKPERDRLSQRAQSLRGDVEKVTEAVEENRLSASEKLRALDKELGEIIVRKTLSPLSDRYGSNRAAHGYLDAVFKDAMAHLDVLQAEVRGDRGERDPEFPFHHYEVNLLVDNSGLKGAPVVALALPSLSHLIGKVEHVPLLVTLITDFMFIRAGALHKANGGFLLIDALDLLQQDVSWETLKRALREARIKIENLAEILDRSQTVTIQPEPIPLDAKIILFGDPWLFHRLRELDPDFAELFKVQVDFANSADRSEANCRSMLRLLATVARSDGLKHLDRSGAAAIIDQSARMAGDAEKISVRTSRIADLMREADHFATRAGRSTISQADVADAVAAREDRAGRLKALEQELVRRRIILIDTEGARPGQINGLTVLSASGFAFGVPARITARVRPGEGHGHGKVLDIERQADYGGPSHTKGVQILTGYINGQYGGMRPLSLAASIAFEQSYGPIDGDSASAAELLAVLSAIAEVPLKQGIAITGSINQHGAMQPVGGVNEKIEGFFDICAIRGFAKQNGVVIPKANLVNLMLRDEVVQGARSGKFVVYAVETIDEAIEVLTGMKAGARHTGGRFPRGTFNRRVADQLTSFARPRVLRPIRIDGWWPF